MTEPETLDSGLVRAGLEAVKQIGGDVLVHILLGEAGQRQLSGDGLGDRVALTDYLRYRDAALDFLQESFHGTAFETGRILVRTLHHQKAAQIRTLVAQFRHAQDKLPVLGQAAVLAAKGSPGVVRASMDKGGVLAIEIERCPECRNLTRASPFCYLNQGVITEFAESHLGLSVQTRETRCAAMGDTSCRIEVVEVKAAA